MYTGERIVPGVAFNVTWQQSLFAYDVVRRWAQGKKILDIGSGEGYGSAYLAEVAHEVVGLDSNDQAVESAAAKYKRANLRFITGDLFGLPTAVGNQKFDIICSFQTIEHVRDHDVFLRALKSVAAPQGKVVVTTPNKLKFPTFNPYHLHEFSAEELGKLFARHFQRVELYGVFGDNIVLEYRADKDRIGRLILRLDPWRARHWLPRPFVQTMYGWISWLIKWLAYSKKKQTVTAVTLNNFHMAQTEIDEALDLLVVGYV